MAKKKLTQARLKEILHYDQDTGLFTWIKDNICGIKIGDIAGCLKQDGYHYIGINYNRYKRSRLAWLYVYGYFPESNIDHIDRIKDNDKIKNLREVSQSCNVRNSSLLKTNKSGVKGVNIPTRAPEYWIATGRINNKSKTLYYGPDLFKAICARKSFENKYYGQ